MCKTTDTYSIHYGHGYLKLLKLCIISEEQTFKYYYHWLVAFTNKMQSAIVHKIFMHPEMCKCKSWLNRLVFVIKYWKLNNNRLKRKQLSKTFAVAFLFFDSFLCFSFLLILPKAFVFLENGIITNITFQYYAFSFNQIPTMPTDSNW